MERQPIGWPWDFSSGELTSYAAPFVLSYSAYGPILKCLWVNLTCCFNCDGKGTDAFLERLSTRSAAIPTPERLSGYESDSARCRILCRICSPRSKKIG